MIITYSPEDGDVQEFEFLPAKLLSPEAEAIEAVGGAAWDTFEQFGEKFLRGSIRAYRAALWVMLKRQNPKLRFQDLTFKIGEVTVNYTKTELTKLKEALEVADDVDEGQRQAALSQINSELEEQEFQEVTQDLKDPSGNSSAEDSISVTQDSLPDSEN
jgi:hypothetical protein